MADLTFESVRWSFGDSIVVGIDEAGRGPLAGPVSAGAVVLPPNFSHSILNDSKKLSAKKREYLYEELSECEGLFWSVSFADVEEIEEKNVLGATHAAMVRAVSGLEREIDYCLIDGLNVPNFPYPSEGIVKGDGKSLSIAAASIFAKVLRDRKMLELDTQYPEYGFAKHKGYGTKGHLEALEKYGPTPIHRRTFAPVARFFDEKEDEFRLVGH